MTRLVLYIFSFLIIWLISELIIKHSQKIAAILKFDPFIVSFFLLGFMTTIPEISIGINSIIDKKPSIFVGNILGGIALLFLFTIPLLSILGKKITLDKKYTGKPLLITTLLVILPYILTINGVVSLIDITVIVLTYLLMTIIFLKNGREKHQKPKLRKDEVFQILKSVFLLLISILCMMIVGNFIVDNTIIYADRLGIPALIISIFAISIGTNLPELIVGIRSIRAGKNVVAYGNYLGSAGSNSLVFAVLAGANIIINNQEVVLRSNLISLAIIVFGFVLFYLFQRSKNELSRLEGVILLLVYILFAMSQLIITF